MMLKLDSCLQIWSPMFIILSDFRLRQKNLFCMFLCIIENTIFFDHNEESLIQRIHTDLILSCKLEFNNPFWIFLISGLSKKNVLYVSVHISKIKLFFTPMKKTWSKKKSCKPDVVIQNYTLRSIKKQS